LEEKLEDQIMKLPLSQDDDNVQHRANVAVGLGAVSCTLWFAVILYGCKEGLRITK